MTDGNITASLWAPGDRVPWPTDATNAQVIITNGDAGGEHTANRPTFYAWVIRDGETVAAAYRVSKDFTLQFHIALREAFDEAESLDPAKFDGVFGSGYSGKPNPPPPVGPGGNGAVIFAAATAKQMVALAGRTIATTKAMLTVSAEE